MMIHVNDISWAQLVLIEIGAILQLAALVAFMKESAKTPHAVRGATEAQMAHQEEAKCKLPVPAIPAKVVEYHRELHGVMEGVPEDVRPANLVKTAKVSFRQSLHPHKEEKPYKPSVRW